MRPVPSRPMARPRFNPFPGLRPFDLEDKPLFFGREQQVVELLIRLREHRFTAAVGCSGSGKSSLIRAGLLPALHGGMMQAAGSHWQVAVMRPGGAPITQLARALCDADLYDPGQGQNLALRLGVTLARSGLGLVEAVRQAALPERTNLLLVVDQFEELFRFTRQTAPAREEAAAFVRMLLEATQQTAAPIFVVLTLRSDFLGECAQYRGLAEAINRSEYLIPRLTRDQWRSAIEGPTRVGGGEIAPRLVQRLLNEVGEDPDQLPLLQHALMRTWDYWVRQGAQDGPIDFAHYEAIGGMAEALSRHADEAYAELPEDRLRTVAARLFKALTEKSLDARGTRRSTRFEDLAEITGAESDEVVAVVEAFRRAGRTFLMPPDGVPLEPGVVVDISHESLMRAWRRLRDWAEEEAQSTRVYRRLQETAQLWRKGEAALLRDPELQIAVLWREANRPSPAWAARVGPGFAEAMELLEASRQARAAELEAEEAGRRRELEQARALADYERLRAEVQARAARRLRWLAAGLAVLVFAVAASLWGVSNARLARANAAVARTNAKVAESRKLAVHAAGMLSAEPELSLLLAVEAWNAQATPEAEAVLRQSLFASNVRARATHPGPVTSVAFSPDGSRFATVSDDGTLGIWRPVPFGPLWLTNGAHQGSVRSLDFSPDSSHVVTGCDDGYVRVWSLATGELKELANPTNVVSALFVHRGASVLCALEDGAVRLWHWGSAGAAGIDHLTNYQRKVTCLAWTPTHQRAAIGTEDGQIDVWNLAGPARVASSLGRGAPDGIRHLAFSADGRWLASAEADGTARVWDVEAGTVWSTRAEAPGGDSPVPEPLNEIRFSLDAARLVTRSDSHLRVYDLINLSGDTRGAVARPRLELPYPAGLTSAAPSPEGDLVLTSGETRAQLKNLEGEDLAEFPGHQGQIKAAALSPDGRWILTGSQDHSARLWANRTGRSACPPSLDTSLLAAHPGGTIVLQTNSQPQWVTLRTTDGTNCVRRGIRAPLDVSRAALTGNGQLLVLAGPTEVVLVSAGGLLAGERVADLVGEDRDLVLWRDPGTVDVSCLAVSEDGRVVAAGGIDGTVRLWESAGGPWSLRQPLRVPDSSGPIHQIGFSGDGRLVFALTDDGIGVWVRPEAQLLAAVRRTDSREAVFHCAAFDPTGRFLGVGCERGVSWVWQLDPLRPVDRQHAHRDQVNAVTWSRDGQFLLTASGDRTAIAWSATRLAEGLGLGKIGVLRVPSGGPPFDDRLAAGGFAQENASIFTVSYSGAIRFFSVEECRSDMEFLLRLAAERSTRPFTPREREVYLHR